MSKKIKLIITEEQATVTKTALECFLRGKLGQFDYMLEAVGGWHLSWEDRLEILRFIRDKFTQTALKEGKSADYYFPVESNSSWGIHHPKVSDALVAHKVEKTIDNYLSVTRNGGYWGSTTNFNEPWGDDLPEIEGFLKHKDYYFNKTESKKIHKFCAKKDFKGAFEYIDTLKDKYDIRRGDSGQIRFDTHQDDPDKLGQPIEHSYYLRVQKPRQKNDN